MTRSGKRCCLCSRRARMPLSYIVFNIGNWKCSWSIRRFDYKVYDLPSFWMFTKRTSARLSLSFFNLCVQSPMRMYNVFDEAAFATRTINAVSKHFSPLMERKYLQIMVCFIHSSSKEAPSAVNLASSCTASFAPGMLCTFRHDLAWASVSLREPASSLIALSCAVCA